MTNLKRSFFWAVLYLAAIFVLGQTDYSGRPIINFASFFYLSILIAFPATLFFPAISRAPIYIPLLIWAGYYLVLLQTLDRSLSANDGEFSVIILEFILLEIGVWFAHQMAIQISHAESVMDALALSAFPNRVHSIEFEDKRIKAELARSRRYHRPLSVVVIESEHAERDAGGEMLKSFQHDLQVRFVAARIGQILDDRVRQTDVLLKDSHGRFIILCPETNIDQLSLMAERVVQAVQEQTHLQISWATASFPDDALTFDDLIHIARDRLIRSSVQSKGQVVSVHAN